MNFTFYATIAACQEVCKTAICEGDSVFLDATWPNSSHLWSTGQLDSAITVDTEGNYVVTITNVPCQMLEQQQVF